MRTIGLIGGMSWESSIVYYRILNEEVKKRLGGAHSAQCLMYSVDFDPIEQLQHEDKWDELTARMVSIAQTLETGGAGCIVICTNTMHLMVEDIEKNTSIPLLHIADAAAGSIVESGMKKAGLLGTKFTMEKDFYTGRLKEKFDIDTIIPGEPERQDVHDIIYHEFVNGTVSPASKAKYLDIIRKLAARGAEAVILGCTEIPLFIKQEDCDIPLLDTTALHATAAVDWALKPE